MFLFLASTLFVFGPSCGGKSSLAKALVQQLGPTWTYLDRDRLIENGLCIDEKADEMIEAHILSFQTKDQNAVVDAQIPWRAQKKDELYILVYAPLPELLARDAKRTVRLRRLPERARYARLYVEKTFAEVFKAPMRLDFQYDLLLDSSQNSTDSATKQVLDVFSKSNILK